MADAEKGEPRVILIATGSEVQLCIDAYETLKRDGIAARVVSMPSWELFERQDENYRNQVLPPKITARVTVEAGAVIGWDRYAGATGTIIGMHSFGDHIWRYKRELPEDLTQLHPTSRGVGLWQDKLYLATTDDHLVALDAKTGKVVWDTEGPGLQEGPVHDPDAVGGERQGPRRRLGRRIRRTRLCRRL